MPYKQDSTTPAGRAVAALNSVTHGGTSKTLFLKDEDPDEFFALLESSFELHQPTNPQDSELVTDAVMARWFLLRRRRLYTGAEHALLTRKPDGLEWIGGDFAEVGRYDRYRTQAERALRRALDNLRHIHKDAESAERWQVQLDRQKQQFTLERERFELLRERQELTKQKEARLAAKHAAKEEKQTSTEPKKEPTAKQKPRKQSREEMLAELIATEIENQEVQTDDEGIYIPQAVFVAQENGVTKVFDRLPDNASVRRTIASRARYPNPPTEVVRTYIFAGVVPPEYQWLIAEEWERHAENLELRQSLTFEEWEAYAAHD